jgi:uncharacterized repeat protein (TIGR01451 family)
MRKLYCLIVLGLLLTATNSFSQVSPFSDCITAYPMCQYENLLIGPVIGEGLDSNEVNPAAVGNCLTTGERNSLWLEFNIMTSGLLSFSIVPVNDAADYDYAIYNLSNANCSDIFTNEELQVACNFSGSTFPTALTGPNGGSNNQDGPPIQVQAAESYLLLVNNFTGINNSGFRIQFTPLNTCTFGDCSSITGKVYIDSNTDCVESFGETRVQGARVGLVNSANIVRYEAVSNEDGVFTLFYPTSLDEYSLRLSSETQFYSQSCDAVPMVIPPSDTLQNIGNASIAVSADLDCFYLSINHTNPFMRNCLKNNRYIQVNNNGAVPSQPTTLTIAYPDYVYPSSSNLTLTYLDAHTIQFDIPAINPFALFSAIIQDSVACDAPPLSEACVHASLANYTNCAEDITGTNLKVTLNCSTAAPDEIESVTISNLNDFPVGPSRRLQMRSWNTILFNQDINLEANSEVIFPAVSHDFESLYIVEPGNNQFITLLNCSTSQNNEFYYQFSELQSGNVNNVTRCNTIFNSYDPNDKTGYPSGEGDDHLIGRNDRFNYRIRFQNTGNAPAFKVVIRDTLSEYLDETTVVKGLSSHPCRYERRLNELIFTFDPILLMDSVSNEPESHGFVEFTVKQKSSNPTNYVINNTAAIYFDFNDPIYTNTFKYTITPVVGIEEIQENKFAVFPNPGNDYVQINLDKELISNLDSKSYIVIRDLFGRMVKQQNITSNSTLINTKDISSGLYLIECKTQNQSFGTVKWIKY